MYLFRESLPKLSGNIRFLHAAPSAPNVDIKVDEKLIGKNIAFSDITKYLNLTPGKHTIKINLSSDDGNSLLNESYEIAPSSYITAAIVLLESTLTILFIKDSNSNGGPDTSFLRFMNLSPSSPLLSLSLPTGDILFNSVEYLETTGYYPLSPGIYNLVVSASGASGLNKYIKNLHLVPGEFLTIYIIGQIHIAPQLGYISVIDGTNNLK
ncbi:MAG: DUF4397 domain-containing protein [Clostridium sp.]